MAERMLPHGHCPECGTSIGVKDKYCSKECERKPNERVGVKKRQPPYLYLGLVAMFRLAMLLRLGTF